MTGDSPLAIIIYVLLAASVYVFFALCILRLAETLGVERSWYAWVPILDIYLTCKIAGKGWAWTFFLFVPVVNLILYILLCLRLARIGKRGRIFAVLLMIPPINLYILWNLAFGDKTMELRGSEA